LDSSELHEELAELKEAIEKREKLFNRIKSMNKDRFASVEDYVGFLLHKQSGQ